MKSEKGIVIRELTELKVVEGPNGESLQDMDYQSLVRLLAIKRAVAS